MPSFPDHLAGTLEPPSTNEKITEQQGDSVATDSSAEMGQDSEVLGDDALQLVSAEGRQVTEEENRTLLKKIDRQWANINAMYFSD